MTRWLLASTIGVLGMGSAIAQPDPTLRQAELYNLLVQDCGSCHGLTLRGGLGPALLPENLRERPRDALIDTVLYGRPGTAMPPWNTLLKREEAAWIIDRLRNGVTSP